MACSLISEEKVTELVVAVIEKVTGEKGVTDQTALGVPGIGLDTLGKRGLYPHIALAVDKAGCILDDIGPSEFVKAKTVGDIRDLVWDDLT